MSDGNGPVDHSDIDDSGMARLSSVPAAPAWARNDEAAGPTAPESGLISTKRTEYFQVGRFGSGGMADVFIGIQRAADGFERLVVIKQVQAHLLTEDSTCGMFMDEARVAAQLNHPNVVRVLDLVSIEDQVSIVMEYIDGEPLEFFRSQFAKQDRAVPLAIACSLVAQACEGLAYAHNAESADGTPLNIIHRDIDLKNLILDSNGYLKIIDFGMARFSAQQERTEPGHLKGKVAYLAPEYVRTGNVDKRADIYALGMVFYELITGVFGRNVSRDDEPKKMFEALNKPPIPATILDPSLPKSVDAIVEKALHPEPTRRYQTAEEFGRELCALAGSVDHQFTPSEIAVWYKTYFDQRRQARLKWERNVMERARILIKDRRKSGPASHPADSHLPMDANTKSSISSAASRKKDAFPKVQVVMAVLLTIALAVVIYTLYQLQQTKQTLDETLDDIEQRDTDSKLQTD